jgi:hypothetical protein
MTTPTNGTLKFIEHGTGRTWHVNIYISDLGGVICPLNLMGLAAAGGPTVYIPTSNVMLADVSIATGPTVSKVIVPSVNGQTLPGAVFDYVSFVSTNPQRPPLSLNFAKGDQISFTQS